MDLLERYLQAVRTYLPKSQQEDILKELRENLIAQIEDKESALGRPLDENELAEILKKHGHPLFVATRYRQTRHLIGSTLFPVYWLVMKIILAVVGVGYAVSVLVLIAQGKPFFEVVGAMWGYTSAVLPTFAVVTIIFAVLDIGNSKFRLLEKVTKESNEKFDPRTLPGLRPAPDLPEARPVPRYKAAIALFFSTAFLLWWIRISPIRRLALLVVLGPVGLADKIPFQLGPVWTTVYWPVIFLSLVSITQHIVALINPDRVRFFSVMQLIANAGFVYVLYMITRASEILVLGPGIAKADEFAEPLRIINTTLHYGMVIAAMITAIECYKQIRTLITLSSRTAPAAGTTL